MESLRHRRSPGTERFLGLFSSPDYSDADGDAAAVAAGVELHESDVLWTSTADGPEPAPTPPATTSANSSSCFLSPSSRASLRRLPDWGSGILAALPEDEGAGLSSSSAAPPLLQRKTSISSASSSASNSPSSAFSTAARMIPAIPKPRPESSMSIPAGRVQAQSLPVNVPVVPRRMRRFDVEATGRADERDEDDHEMMPPHEIVARTYGRGSPTTFSVLEGAGRTLKGRDLRRVRDAVFRQTGFLD